MQTDVFRNFNKSHKNETYERFKDSILSAAFERIRLYASAT